MGSSGDGNVIIERSDSGRNICRDVCRCLLFSPSLTLDLPSGGNPRLHQGGIAMFSLKKARDMILGETKFRQVQQ